MTKACPERLLSQENAGTGWGLTRRDFLRVGGLGALGLSLSDARAAGGSSSERAVILLVMVGGPSQLETWDPKPDAPSEVRGPFRSIATAVPGVRINEFLPRIARRLDRVTLVRSLHHDAAPIHETGLQLLQTGKLCRLGQEYPHFGSVVARLKGSRNDLPPSVMIPGPIGNTGVAVSHGQTAGALGAAFEPFLHDPSAVSAHRAFDPGAERVEVRDAYGRNTFGQSCLLARRLVESGVRLVTVNMFETVFNRVTWDCHGARPFSTLDDYRRVLLPAFDTAFSALIDDLERSGRLDTTLVVATGEFGRTPRLNAAGGRDHWPRVWSAAMAGGGIRGGQVIGASDEHAAEPADRPVSPPELLATIYRSLGIDPSGTLADAEGVEIPLCDGAAIAEAFA
jgi:uncharacterized protein (DUF1501 family)